MSAAGEAVPAVTPTRRYRREPAVSNRVENEPWWDHDRRAHAADCPEFCPSCGAGLDDPGSIAVEFWSADRRTFHTRCGGCGWSGDITRTERMVGPDAPHE